MSIIFMMTPPWTFPAGLASWGFICCAKTACDFLTFFPSILDLPEK
jgi:hypothetical protein